LAVFDFEAHIMLSVCLTFQGTDYTGMEIKTPIWLRMVNFLLVVSIDF